MMGENDKALSVEPEKPSAPQPPKVAKPAVSHEKKSITKKNNNKPESMEGDMVETNTEDQSEIKTSSVFEPIVGLKCTTVDNEFILSDPLEENGYRLNTIGSIIFQFICDGETVGNIVKKLAKHYDRESDQMKELVFSYVRQLLAVRLIVKPS